MSSCYLVPLSHEQLRNNFKVELRWLPLTKLTQIFNERALAQLVLLVASDIRMSGCLSVTVSLEQLEQLRSKVWKDCYYHLV